MTSVSTSVEHLLATLVRTPPQPVDGNLLVRHQHELLSHARTRGLGPLVYYNLQQAGRLHLLEEAVQAALQQAFYRTLADNIQILDSLKELAREIGRQNISTVVLKGPALIQLVYGRPGLRPMTDIDLLVHPADASRTGAILRGLGYTPVPLYPDLFQKNATVLDVHIDPINRSRIRSRARAVVFKTRCLWRNSIPLPGFEPLRMLDLPDQVLTLSVHALKHGFQKDIWLVDIARCLERVEDWPGLRRRALQSRTDRILAPVFWMLRKRLLLVPPQQALAIPPLYRPGALEQRLLETASVPGMPQVLEALFFTRAIPDLSGKVRYLLELAFPRPQILRQAAGRPARFWLSYLLRIARLLRWGLIYILRFARGARRTEAGPEQNGIRP